jgi:hypothetical protein
VIGGCVGGYLVGIAVGALSVFFIFLIIYLMEGR